MDKPKFEKGMIVDFLIIILFFIALQFLVFTFSPDSPAQSYLVHVFFAVMLCVLAFVKKQRGFEYFSGLDYAVIAIFFFRIINMAASPVKGTPFNMLSFAADNVIAYFIGKNIFRRTPALFTGVFFGFSIVFGASSLFFYLRNDQQFFRNNFLLFLSMAFFSWVIILYYLFPWFTKSNHAKKMYLLLIPVYVVTLWFFFLKPIYINNHSANKVRQRIISNQIETRVFSEYPILGVGVGNLKSIYINYKPEPNFVYDRNYSSFFSVPAEVGVVGLLLYLAVMLKFFSKLKKVQKVIEGVRTDCIFFWGNLFLLFSAITISLAASSLGAPHVTLLIYALFGFLAGYLKRVKERAAFHINDLRFNFAYYGIVITITVFLLIYSTVPLIGSVIMRNSKINECYIGLSPEFQISLLKLSMPFNPETYRREANLLKDKALSSATGKDFNILLVENAYKKAISCNPYNPASHLEMANFYIKNVKNIESAKMSLASGIKYCPTEWEIRFLLGKCHELLKEYDAALKCYRDTVFLNPKFAEAHTLIAKINSSKGLKDNALDEYSIILQKNPQKLGALKLWLESKK